MLQISKLTYRYSGAHSAQLRIDGIRLSAGERAILLGPSGCGKSTLLHLIAGILKPQEGELIIADTDLKSLSARETDHWRGKNIGFLPQKLALVPSLSVRENLLLAAYAAGHRADYARAEELLSALSLSAEQSAKPHQLSQGQRQRVAIARAVFNRPRLLLADEPTANLDDAACDAAVRLLAAQAAAVGATMLIATHDARVLAALPDAVILRLSEPANHAGICS